MNKKIIITIFFALIAIFTFAHNCQAADLDEITNYTVTVEPRDDGTLDIKYHIAWKVLDSTTEGPLEWVKIGIPNQHVNQIKKLTKNIKKIKYNSQGGNFVRIDFKDKYKAGETVVFEFSIHQSYMYTINNSTGKVTYTFTPGWFSDIEVKQATVQWKEKDILRHTGKSNGEYITWSRALGKNQKLTAKVEYSVGRFKLNYNKQANNAVKTNAIVSNPHSSILLIFVLFIIVYAVTMVLAVMSPSYYRHGGYGYYGGFYPYRHYHHYHHHGGFHRRRFRWRLRRRPEVVEALHVPVHVLVPEADEQDVQKKIFMELI